MQIFKDLQRSLKDFHQGIAVVRTSNNSAGRVIGSKMMLFQKVGFY